MISDSDTAPIFVFSFRSSRNCSSRIRSQKLTVDISCGLDHFLAGSPNAGATSSEIYLPSSSLFNLVPEHTFMFN